MNLIPRISFPQSSLWVLTTHKDSSHSFCKLDGEMSIYGLFQDPSHLLSQYKKVGKQGGCLGTRGCLMTSPLPYLQMFSSLMFLWCSLLSPQLPSLYLYLYQHSWHHAPFFPFHLLYHVELSPLGYHLSRSCCGRQSRQSCQAGTPGRWQDAVIQFSDWEKDWRCQLGQSLIHQKYQFV